MFAYSEHAVKEQPHGNRGNHRLDCGDDRARPQTGSFARPRERSRVVTATPTQGAAGRSLDRPPFEGGRPGSGRQFRTFESFDDRDFRWFYLALLGQMAAMNMQMLARGYLAFDLTGSFAALGVVSLGSAAPMLILSVFGGVLADRAPKKLVLQLGQLANAVTAVIVGFLLLFDLLQFAHLLVAGIAHGIALALMMPSRQAILPEVVGMERLMNAVSLSAAASNLMRLAAPALGGFMIAFIGAEWVYFLMAALYGFAVVTLGQVRLQHEPAARPRRTSGYADLVEGVRYVIAERTLGLLLLAGMVGALLALPYQIMLPGFVRDVLGGGPIELGLLIAVSAVGSLAGSLVLASLPARRRGLLLLLSSLFVGVALIGFASTRLIWLSGFFMLFVGIGSAGRQALGNVLLQHYSLDEYRGRVMSLYMTEFGIMSFGAVLFGLFAEQVGGQWAFGTVSAVLVVLTLAMIAFLPRLRRLD
ncbi:MAG: MFS transporter [Chloroflexi bacterium]|nr:MFS transporter [Chloroflexota bacterium]